ncbi:Small subunit (SSU) processome component [Ascosphaera aggregata]|nr:Small subunit (SSU) processome component [Ascosphaera aggregata]
MPPKTPSRAAAAAAATTTPSSTIAASSSAILRSAFSPPSSRWALFASVVQGLDAQRLRIHEVSSLRLVAEHSLLPKEQILCMDWGYVSSTAGDNSISAKKRRRTAVSSSGSALLAFGTNLGTVKLYSPAENKIATVLEGQHDRAVLDVKFTAGSSEEAYSLGADGKLCRWDLKTGRCSKSLSLPSTSVSTLSRPVTSSPSVLVASQTPFLVNLDAQSTASDATHSEAIVSFAAMKNTIHTLIASSSSQLSNAQFLAADADRYINLFDVEERRLLGNLVATKAVELLTLRNPQKKQQQQKQQVLVAVTRDDTIELFTQPFAMAQQQQQQQQGSNAASLKSLRKSQTRRPTASLTLRRPNSSTPIHIIAAQFTFDGALLLAYVENGVIPIFEKVEVVDKESGEIAWTGKKEIVREKISSLGALPNAINAGVNGIAGKEVRVDESQTVVESGVGGHDDGDDDEMDLDDEDDDQRSGDDASDTEAAAAKQTPRRKTTRDSDAMDLDKNSHGEKGEKEDEEEEEAEDDTAEPSFGDLIKAQEVVDVEATLLAAQTRKNASAADVDDALVPAAAAAAVKSKTLGAPGSGVSLSNVLSQALKTNDNNLLESCFHTTDTAIVRATIQRIDSALAATLLQRLAERLSTRPGRYGHLLVWVQWTCVAHGGSIAGKPGLLRQLTDVFKVMEQRSASLAPLLLLKGKLDMLDAQLGLRRALKGEERRREEEFEDEDNVIYVEGMEDIENDDNDFGHDHDGESDNDGGEGRLLIEEARTGATPAAKKMKRKRDAKEAGLTNAELEMFSDGEEEESGDNLPLTVNEIDSDDSENEEGSSDEELVDEEAEVSGEDVSSDEDDEDEDEDDENLSDMDDFINDDVSEEEVEEEVKPKKSGKRGKGGR